MTHKDEFDRAGEARLHQLLEMVRDDRPARPGFRDAVMREISALPDSPWRRALDWLLEPRSVRFRPATAGLALAAVVAALLLVPLGGPSEGDLAVAPPAQPAGVVTRFVFIAPEAGSVALTGDFIDWDPSGIPLAEQRGNGVWTIDVPLDPGIYEYAFVIDGQEWRPDPLASSSVDDGFGRENSVVIVAGGRT
jgi:hypothetical protein